MHEYTCSFGRIVLDLAYLDLAFFKSFEYRVDYRAGIFAVWYLGHGHSARVDFLDFGSYFDKSATASVVVFAYVDQASGSEVRI